MVHLLHMSGQLVFSKDIEKGFITQQEFLRTYVERPKQDEIEEKTETFTGTFSCEASNYWNTVVVPTGIEPVFPT